MPRLHVAIVGSGPAGMYLLEALARSLPAGLAVDVIDRLPTPFGLIRSGVAPDHGSVKAVTTRFEQALERPGVRFVGGVEVERDMSLQQLRSLYDAVVLANGCPLDKPLGIPGEHLPGVWGSARFTGWYNGHPDHAALPIAEMPQTVVVIGNGNVAIDVARLLAKPHSALADTDMSHAALKVLGRSQVRKVVLAGRRGPADARFSVKELEELGEIANVSVALPEGAALPDDAQAASLPAAQSSMLQALNAYAANGNAGRPAHRAADLAAAIELRFLARPVAILGSTRVEAVRFERMQVCGAAVVATGSFFDIPCGAVVTCIGYMARPLASLPMDPARGVFANNEGLIDAGLYCTGWARRGPSGTIATNRSDANHVAQRIVREARPGNTEGPAGLDRLLAQRGLTPVDLAGWRAIDTAERARTVNTAPRQKILSVAEMLAVARTARAQPAAV